MKVIRFKTTSSALMGDEVLPVARSFHFLVYGDPLGQNAVYKRGRGNRLYMTDEGKTWRNRVAIAAAGALPDGWAIQGPKEVHLIHYFSNPRRDIDGPVKLELDALERIAYLRDAQVVDLTVKKRIDKLNPRAEITVWQAWPPDL
jgi:Holliday junction resolvase RusA-like endonuclease